MLNPYTLKPERPAYRDDSTMAIAIRKSKEEKYLAKLEKREARKYFFRSLFKRS